VGGRRSGTTIVAENGKPTFKVDVNSATVADMQRVPGMSENLARAIVNNRPYKDALDLVDRIPNLDPRLVRAYSPYLTYGPARTATQK
jgi:DNA uptake protein ComE-like DNA-binding protein